MNPQELKEVLDTARNTISNNARVEFKAARQDFPKRLWESLSSFANTPGGGIIILGVSETPGGLNITGVTHPHKLQSDAASLCDQMVPPLRPLIETHHYEDKSIITIEIPEISFKEKPCYYKGSGMMSGAFIRVADGDRQLTQYEIQGFLDGRGQPMYDVDIVPDATKEDLAQDLLSDLIAQVRKKHLKMSSWNDDKILHTFRILREKDGQESVTLCGLLCFGVHPQSFFPALTIHVLAYPTEIEGQTGIHGERLLDDVKVEGPLTTMVPEAIAAVKKNLSRKSLVKDLLREDVWQFPDLFLREAIVNAVAHRDYSPFARGTSVQIKIFPTRLEIINPGGLFGPITADQLGAQGIQATRNGFLMKLLEDTPVPGQGRPLCENRGTGIPSMVNALRKAGVELPEFQDSRSLFKVSSRDHTIFDEETLNWLGEMKGMALSDHQRYALAHARKRERITNADYCRMNDCDSRLATKELCDLVKKQLLIPHETRRWASYTLPTPKAEAPQKRRRRDWSEDILKFVAKKGNASRRDIQSLGLKPATAYYWVRRLVKKGRLKPTGRVQRDPKTKYKLSK